MPSVSVKSLYSYQLEFFFKAPYSAESVIFTGEFDGWQHAKKMHLIKVEKDFKVFNFQIPVAKPITKEKFVFKFVVDGVWCTSDAYPLEYDVSGNLNNVIYYDCTKSDNGSLTKMLLPTNEDLARIHYMTKKYLRKDSAIEKEKKVEEGEENSAVMVCNLSQIATLQGDMGDIKRKPKKKGCSIQSIFNFFQRKSKIGSILRI